MEAVKPKEKDVSGEVNKASPSIPEKHCHKLNGVSDENENHCKRIKSSPSPGDTVDNASGSEPPPSSVSPTVTAAPPGRVPEKLEVPSKELQLIQKQVMIEKLMSSPTKSSKDKLEPMDVQSVEGAESCSKDDKPKNHHSKRPSRGEKRQKSEDFRKTFKLHSSVLDRVKTFLPTLKTANDQLIRLPDPSKLSLESESDFDIENDDTDGPVPGPSNNVPGETKPTTSQSKTYVEMNLALVEHSDSDTSSDGEGPVLSKPLKKSLLPDNLGKIRNNENELVEAEASSNCKITEIKESVTKTETRDG